MFLHRGHLGDVVYSIPAARRLSVGRPVHYYLRLDDRSHSEKLLPLLNAQPDMTASVYSGEPAHYNLDKFREINFNLNQGCLARLYGFTFPVDVDLSQPWLDVAPDDDYAGRVLVNRTPRYRNPSISYGFLANVPDTTYVGIQSEYSNFLRTNGPFLPFAEFPNFLALTRAIKACRLFIGNQSFPYALAEALKVPRVLEVCPSVPNVIPHGLKAFDCIRQGHFEVAVRRLLRGE